MSLADFVMESFGGYEKAKAVLDIPNAHFLHNIEGLKQRLLEYRRQHNIFEVGDKIAYHQNIAPEHNNIYEVWKIDLVGCLIFLGDMDYRAIYNQIRHATDEEIKAGKRLEVDTIDRDIDKQVNLMDQFIADGGFDKAFADVFGLPESVKKSLEEIS